VPAPRRRPGALTTARPSLAGLVGQLPQVEWPPVLTGGRASLAALLYELDDTQWWEPAALAAAQARQLRTLGEWFASRSGWVRDRLRTAGLTAAELGEPGALSSLPVLTRRELQAAGAELFVDAVPSDHLPLHQHSTSGSTGEPVVVRRTMVTRLFFAAFAIRDYLWRGVDLGGGLSAIRGTIGTHVERPTWGGPVDNLFRTGPSQSLPINLPVDTLFEHLVRFQPTLLVAYPTVIRALCERQRDSDPALTELAHVQAIGETVTPELRGLVEEVLGARLWDLYSSEELGFIAAQCPDGGTASHVVENQVVELLDDHGQPVPVGVPGRVVVTDLVNLATPLLRYDIGDYAVAGPACACGRGLPVIADVLGRERNLVRMPDGTRRFPLVGFSRFRSVAPVEQYQMVQTDQDLIEVRLVATSPLTAEHEAALSEVITEALGHRFALRFAYFDGALPAGPGGKFEEFRSEVP
jgi:phenylacetate-CoA ligase